MIIHDEAELLPYQKEYLNARKGVAMRTGGYSAEQATQHVLNSYPNAAAYLYERWGNNYFVTDKYTPSCNLIPKPIEPIPQKPRDPLPAEENCNKSIELLVQKPDDTEHLSEQQEKNYVKTDEDRQSFNFIPKPVEPIPKKQRIPSPEEIDYNKHVDLLAQKMEKFQKKPNCEKAFNAAKTLYHALKKEGEDYFSGELSKENYDQFKNNCESFIKTARPELDQHRGCAKILVNITAIIISIGIGYGVAALINIALNKGKFTFFSTDSSIKINSIEKNINKLAPE